ncbi:MAG: molybdopterin-guanine dinucleotide biosynthesis protein B [Desulfobacteraceae bacterium]|nr:MAG: molybdopterin-guanine dinucleotide biosynthesis protein B [Desulfobacteraceae bacterium]
MVERDKVPILSIVGFSGSGKTTYIVRLIPALTSRGLKVATIKHHHREFDLDKPGKDTWRHKQAGAAVTVISSPARIGVVMDADHDHSPDELAFFARGVDLILTEGYKRGGYPKVEIFRPEATENKKPFCLDDPALLALVSNEELDLKVPLFDFEDVAGVAELIIKRFGFTPKR